MDNLNDYSFWDLSEFYKKATFLSNAKYKTTLLQDKLIAIALSKMPYAKEDKEGSLTVEIKATELKKILNLSGGSFYERLKESAKNLTGKSIGYSDPEKKVFEYISVIQHSMYKNGVLYLEFNKHLKSYLKDIGTNYTWFYLSTIMSFKSIFSLRLYELLKAKSFTPKGIPDTGKYKFSFSLSELKLELGLVNAELEKVRNILNGTKTPDYDKAVAVAPERLYDSWPELRRKVIIVAINEINKKTDMEVSFDPLTTGRGSRTYGVAFYVNLNNNNEEKNKQKNKAIEQLEQKKEGIDEEEKAKIYKAIFELIDEKINMSEVMNLAEDANYDIELIKEKYKLAKKQKKIRGIVGWLRDAIKNDWTDNVPKENKKDNNYFEYSKNDYDFNDLEEKLLKKKGNDNKKKDKEE